MSCECMTDHAATPYGAFAAVATPSVHGNPHTVPSASHVSSADAALALPCPPCPRDACSYFVSVLPLDHTNTFDSNASLADFVLSPGRLNHSITVNPVLKQAVVSYTGSSWQSATLGRGYSPYAFRRMPEGGAMEIGNVSCPLRPAGAARWSCGMVAFNVSEARQWGGASGTPALCPCQQ